MSVISTVRDMQNWKLFTVPNLVMSILLWGMMTSLTDLGDVTTAQAGLASELAAFKERTSHEQERHDQYGEAIQNGLAQIPTLVQAVQTANSKLDGVHVVATKLQQDVSELQQINRFSEARLTCAYDHPVNGAKDTHAISERNNCVATAAQKLLSAPPPTK